jgi:SMODS-associating 4TM effector domain
MPSIMDRQNDKPLMDLLRANHFAHDQAMRLDTVRFGFAVLIAAAGLFATFQSSLAPGVSLLGALWAVLYILGLSTWSSRELRRAAVLQEMFDTELFGMRWNTVLAHSQLPVHEVNSLSRRFRGDDGRLRDYYEIPDIPKPFDVLACQQQNLAWGSRVHERYAHFCLGVAVALAAAGPVLALAAGLTVSQMILRWYVPALGLLLLTTDNWRSHLFVSRERERTLTLMDSRIDETLEDPFKAKDLPVMAREIQDLLLLTRLRVARVPGLFFLRYHSTDREDFEATLNYLLTRIAPLTSP